MHPPRIFVFFFFEKFCHCFVFFLLPSSNTLLSLLQRDVEVVLESSSNNSFVGSVIHPLGNIAEALLKEGMAKCVDWSISKVYAQGGHGQVCGLVQL